MTCDPLWNKTVLACHFDGANGSTTFTDERGLTLTAYGNAQLTTTSPKFGTACATFDGTGDYIVAAASADYVVRASEFTLEGWFYFSGFATNHAYGTTLFDLRPVGSYASGMALFANASGVLTCWDSNATATQSGSGKVTTGQWYHVAICRSGGRMRVFVGGVSVIDYAHIINYAPATTTLVIGSAVDYQDTSANFKHNGKLDAVRFTKAARYTANFTPDTSAFLTNQCTISGTVKDATGANVQRLVRVLDRKTCSVLNAGLSDPSTGAYSLPVATANEVMVLANDAVGDPLWHQTVLACHFDGSNGSVVFTNECGHPITANGNAKISTAQSKYGGASLYLDGNGDYVSLDAAILSAHATDVTIECWFKLGGTPSGDAYNTAYYILSFGPNKANSGCDFYVGNTQIRFNHYDYSVNILSGTWTPDTNWHHVAVVRSGDAWVLYLDGTSIATKSNSTAFLTHTGTLAIGGCEAQSGGDNTGWFNGYIDDLRITKAARYTGNFTPGTSAFLGALSGGTENALIFDNVIPV